MHQIEKPFYDLESELVLCIVVLQDNTLIKKMGIFFFQGGGEAVTMFLIKEQYFIMLEMYSKINIFLAKVTKCKKDNKNKNMNCFDKHFDLNQTFIDALKKFKGFFLQVKVQCMLQ